MSAELFSNLNNIINHSLDLILETQYSPDLLDFWTEENGILRIWAWEDTPCPKTRPRYLPYKPSARPPPFSFVFIIYYVHNAFLSNELDLSREEGMYFSVVLSFRFFSLFKKRTSRTRITNMSRDERIFLSLELAGLYIVTRHANFPKSNSDRVIDMAKHLMQYLDYLIEKVFEGLTKDELIFVVLWGEVVRRMVYMDFSGWADDDKTEDDHTQRPNRRIGRVSI